MQGYLSFLSFKPKARAMPSRTALVNWASVGLKKPRVRSIYSEIMMGAGACVSGSNSSSVPARIISRNTGSREVHVQGSDR
jgi:hypothetical protein